NTPEETNIIEVIESVLRELRPVAQKRTIKLNITLGSSSVPPVKVDPRLFREVITNLVSNAVKYNFPGHPVDVSVEVEPANVHIRVADKGIGIPEKDQSRLFTRFFRAEN